MPRLARRTFLTAGLVASSLGAAESAHAGWICITNDTTHVLIVQEAANPLTPWRRQKKSPPLLPGEAYREFQACGTEKKMQVFDARCPTRPPILQGTLTWQADDVSLKLEVRNGVVTLPLPDQKPPAMIEPAKTPSSSR